MGRIRSIKPEFPQSEAIGRLSREARLLFIQLWTIVDDEGRARAASRMLASLLYPYDDDASKHINGWLAELQNEKQIRIYEVDGSHYLDIPNWLKHQRIDRPTKSRLPEFVEPSRGLATDLGPRTLDLGSGSLLLDARSSDGWPKDFKELFWKAYPRKVGKLAALGKLEVVRRRGGVAFDQLMAAIARINASDPKFIPHPVTWLSQGRYLDGDPIDTEAARNYRELQRKTEEYRRKVYGEEKRDDAIRHAPDGSGTESPNQDDNPLFPPSKTLQ